MIIEEVRYSPGQRLPRMGGSALALVAGRKMAGASVLEASGHVVAGYRQEPVLSFAVAALRMAATHLGQEASEERRPRC